MNKREKEVMQTQLEAEKLELRKLQVIYKKAAADISSKIEFHQGKIDVLLSEIDEMDDAQRSILQSQIYQRDFQKSLKSQIEGFTKDLNSKQWKSVEEYLENCYTDAFVGSAYSMHQQGIPLVMPIDQKKVVDAMRTVSPISKELYEKMGEDVDFLKKRIANNISRGIASGESYETIARNIANDSNMGMNKAMRIARTEGHGVQCKAAFDQMTEAKKKGADVLKQWNSTLDGKTRDSHRRVDGELRELDEKFSNGMKYPSDRAGGPAEVINCRCALLQRARWELDEEELDTLKERARFFGLDKTENFEDFKKKYLQASKKVLESPQINDIKLAKASEDFAEVLNNSNGVKAHVTRMQLHREYTDYRKDNGINAPFMYDADEDAILYNTKADNFDRFDLAFVQAHELSHRMDILEYNSMESKEFKAAISACAARVLADKDKIQKDFEEGGKYYESFALADIISALTKNEIIVLVGHTDEYWETEENVIREIFANISAIDVLDTDEKEEFESLLKELYEVYKEIVE